MRRLLRLVLITVAAALLATDSLPARAQSFSDTQRGEIERIIKEYLVAHPEVLQEVIAEIEKRQSDAEAVKHRDGVKQYSQALFYSPRQVTIGNRQGDVTLVDRCCGMDGTWGMKKEFFQDSLKVAEPAARKVDALEPDVVSSDCPLAGLQLRQKTGRSSYHPVKILQSAYRGAPLRSNPEEKK